MKTRKKSWSCCIFDKNVHENDKKNGSIYFNESHNINVNGEKIIFIPDS